MGVGATTQDSPNSGRFYHENTKERKHEQPDEISLTGFSDSGGVLLTRE
jgi:hypothetical protein